MMFSARQLLVLCRSLIGERTEKGERAMNGIEVLVERPERHYLFKNPESEKVKELQELEGCIRRLARGMSESSLQIGVYLKEIRDKCLYYYEGVSSELPEYQKKAYFSDRSSRPCYSNRS